MAVGFGCTEFKAATEVQVKRPPSRHMEITRMNLRRLDFEILIEIRVALAYRWQLKFGTR